MNLALRTLLLVVLVFTACDPLPRAKLKPTPPPTPPLGPPAQRSSSGERLRTEEAMNFADLSLLVRMSTPEAEIMQQIAQRGFLDPINATQAQSLAALGASPRLIIVVQDRQYVLTPAERQGYFNRKGRRDAVVQGKATASRKQAEAEFAERQRQLELQQKTYDMVAQREREQQQREAAKLAYERKRKELETDIENLKDRITNYRRYGYRENDLAGMNRQLKALQDDLFNLKAP